MKKNILIVLLVLILVGLIIFGVHIVLRDDNGTDTPLGQSSNLPDISSEAMETLLSQTLLIGDVENFALPRDIAFAYAEAIRTAGFNSESGERIDFDEFYVVLLDVSGDGVPLLLLVKEELGHGLAWDTYRNLLFGFAGGEIQEILEYSTGIGIATENGERLLLLALEHDFGGKHHFYRVSNGSAEFVSTTTFVYGIHENVFTINGVDVAQEEVRAMFEEDYFERFMWTSHHGPISVTDSFGALLVQTLTRDQAEQLFLDYANH